MKIIYDIDFIIKNRDRFLEKPSDLWLEYFSIHSQVFKVLMKNIYRLNQKELLSLVDNTDFQCLFSQAVKNHKQIDSEEIKNTLEECVNYYNFKADFDVFFLIGLGHIDGTAQVADRPFLYFGLERVNASNISPLIKHEFNHMVRFTSIDEIGDFTEITVGQLVIAEGLATLSPLFINQQQLNRKNLISALFMSNQEYEVLSDEHDIVIRKFFQDADKTLSKELHLEYFIQNDETCLQRKGYYIGMMLIIELIDVGLDLKILTETPTEIILNNFN
ncbi:DUF2268 domain-containing putative Zn-dependent protease [Corticicoccus populi]|uniref:DUF2268 domain-containing putative Zn-dependent protease n=1 Tax=Corticicoccus populi TaxID=1812821 RepID=A0ABW5WTX4_9STAP